MKIKICGITTQEDALAAVEAGADEIGFNFYRESPRYIEPPAAAAIAETLPEGISRVGVFVNEDPFRIADIAELVDLDAVQLHGDEDRDMCEKIRHLAGATVIKAVDGSAGADLERIADFRADAVLVDSYSEGIRGGTGTTFDWAAAKPLFERFESVYVAGGLNSENVSEAIETLDPYAVDVCSGVESSPGRKDHAKLREFIDRARETGQKVDGK